MNRQEKPSQEIFQIVRERKKHQTKIHEKENSMRQEKNPISGGDSVGFEAPNTNGSEEKKDSGRMAS